MFNKFKLILTDDAFFYAVVIMLIAVTSFGLGRYSDDSVSVSKVQPGITVIQPTVMPASAASAVQENQYVASKNGTKYYLLWCSGVNRIKEENKVYFNTTEEAEAQGYSKAANCKGI